MTTEEINQELDKLEERVKKIVPLASVEKNRQGIELHQKLKRLKTNIDDATNNGTSLEGEKARLHALAAEVVRHVFDMDDDALAAMKAADEAEHLFYSVRVSFRPDAPIASTRLVRDAIIEAFADNPHVTEVTVRPSK